MADVKTKSLIQLLNIDSADLTTPIHDKLMFWLNRNWKSVIDVTESNAYLHLEYTIMSNRFVIGSIDAVAFMDLHEYIGFEIKSKVQSFGELIRQINIYKDSMRSLGYKCLLFYVVVPHNVGKDEEQLLLTQNIHVHTVENME